MGLQSWHSCHYCQLSEFVKMSVFNLKSQLEVIGVLVINLIGWRFRRQLTIEPQFCIMNHLLSVMNKIDVIAVGTSNKKNTTIFMSEMEFSVYLCFIFVISSSVTNQILLHYVLSDVDFSLRQSEDFIG